MCCGKTIKIRSEFAMLTVYDLEFSYQARSYHGKCGLCKTAFYHGYTVCDEERVFDLENTELFSFNSGLAFSWQLIKWIDSMVCVGSMSFEKVGAS
jgi:hypothetical protein